MADKEATVMALSRNLARTASQYLGVEAEPGRGYLPLDPLVARALQLGRCVCGGLSGRRGHRRAAPRGQRHRAGRCARKQSLRGWPRPFPGAHRTRSRNNRTDTQPASPPARNAGGALAPNQVITENSTGVVRFRESSNGQTWSSHMRRWCDGSRCNWRHACQCPDRRPDPGRHDRPARRCRAL